MLIFLYNIISWDVSVTYTQISENKVHILHWMHFA